MAIAAAQVNHNKLRTSAAQHVPSEQNVCLWQFGATNLHVDKVCGVRPNMCHGAKVGRGGPETSV